MGSHLTCGKRSTDCVQDNLGKVKVSLGLLDLFDNNFNLFFKDTFFQDLCYLVQIAIESFWMHTHLQKCSLPGKVSFSLVLFKIGIYLAVQVFKATTHLQSGHAQFWKDGLFLNVCHIATQVSPPLVDGAVCQVARQRLFGRFPPGGDFVQPALVPSVAGGARAGWLEVSII